MKHISQLKKSRVFLCATATVLISGCSVYLGPGPEPVPGPVVVEPAVEVSVPAYYVWDGVEYVGEYNGRFMYFGPGGAWIWADPVIIGRFHGWEGYHADWRDHAIRNERENRLDHAHRAIAEHRAVQEHRAPQEQHRTVQDAHRPAPPQHAPPSSKKKDDKDDHR